MLCRTLANEWHSNYILCLFFYVLGSAVGRQSGCVVQCTNHLQTAFGLLWCWRWHFLERIVTGDEEDYCQKVLCCCTKMPFLTLLPTLFLKKLNFEVLEHPLYSLDLTPLDQQLDVTVHVWLVSEPKTFCSEGIKQIVRWWTKCILKNRTMLKNYAVVRSLPLFL